MSAIPKKLRLNIQTLRQLTNQEAAFAVAAGAIEVTSNGLPECQGTHGYECQPPPPPTQTCYTYCGCVTAANEQCCADGTVSTLRWDF